jgi:hypothetical protein
VRRMMWAVKKIMAVKRREMTRALKENAEV